ncbi:hypothetical protein ACFL35_08195 [Candidatus Riflebacteria bacterium]
MNPKKMRFRNSRKGVALFFIITSSAILSMILYGLLYITRSQARLSHDYINDNVAMNLAEAGYQHAIWSIRKDLKKNGKDSTIYKMITDENAASGGKGTPIQISTQGLFGKGLLSSTDGHSEIKLEVKFFKSNDLGSNEDNALPNFRFGYLHITSAGRYLESKKQIEVRREVSAFLNKHKGFNKGLGMVAPEHGFFVNKARRDAFYPSGENFFDPKGFKIEGGKVFIRDGATIPITKAQILTDLRDEMDHPLMDKGFGILDTWFSATHRLDPEFYYPGAHFFNSGFNFGKADSLEYENNGIYRTYQKWQGPFNWPWYRKTKEPYSRKVRQKAAPADEDINLYPAETYKKLATRVLDRKQGKHQAYFKNFEFQEMFRNKKVKYDNVLPLYGWGKWQNVNRPFWQALFKGNPTKAHDTSHAVNIDGLTFVRGDVFLEGWVKGKGMLVVQGNLVVGGDVLTLPDTDGSPSSLNIIVLEDPERKPTNVKQLPRSGSVIYKPHHDSDWDKFGLHQGRDYTPRIEASVYSKRGLKVDTDSAFETFINMTIVGNYVTNEFDQYNSINDVKIKYFNWQKVLEGDYEYYKKHFHDGTTREYFGTDYTVGFRQSPDAIIWKETPITLL